MSETYTPTAQLAFATNPRLPQGDPANLAFVRDALDVRALLASGLRGVYAGSDRVTIGGDAAAPSLAIGNIDAALVRDSALAWKAMSAFGVSPHLPGALAASTIHYLYQSATGFSVSTTPPTYPSYLATGNELRFCLCAFATGLLGFPLPAVVSRRSGRYIASSGRAELVALDNGQAVAWAAVDLSALVPPTATTAWVMARVYRAAADAGGIEVQVRRSSADGGYLTAARANASGGGVGETVDTYDEKLVAVPLLSQAFEYQLNAAVTAGAPYGARFIVVGWE